MRHVFSCSRIFTAMLLITVVFSLTADSANKFVPHPVAIILDTDNFIKLGAVSSPQDTCNLPFPGLASFLVPDWLSGDETYFVYQDPKTSNCTGTIPFGLFGVIVSVLPSARLN